MTTASVIVQGTVTPEGGLNVEQKVPLPPGPVKITIQPANETPHDPRDWWQHLQDARAVLEARGSGFRTQEEIEREREAFRAEC